MRLLIDNGLGPKDYTRYVVDGSLTVEDSINVPTLLSFQLAATDTSFVTPRRSAYATVQSEIYASGTGYGQGKVLATGFVTNTPERTYMGLSAHTGPTNNQVYTYNVNVTSDEWLLNCNAVPYIPAFVNQTDSQILASIATALMPGFFNTTLMASGTLVPYFQYDPSQTWSDIAKTFADANRFHYKVINRQIIYQPFGDKPLGIAYNDLTMKEKNISPLELKTGVLTVPPVNDCIVIGDIEPQTNWDNYFVGDGFSSNFQLKHIVFDGASNNLLQDDWTEASFTQGNWIVQDPLGVFVLADTNGNAVGALNVIQAGANGVYTPQTAATFIQATNGLELGGGINLQHGQVTFNDAVTNGGGIIGGVYGTNIFTPGTCLAGFAITGQQAVGPYTVSHVQILTASTHSVVFTIASPTLGKLQPGYVLGCSSFGGASFLNGTKVTIQNVTQTSPGIWQITCLSLALFASPYNAADSGSVSSSANDVLITASGTAGIVIQPLFEGQLTGIPVVSQVNHQYVLQTWIGANTQSRYTRPYSNLTRTNTYGDQNLAAAGAITWVVTDVNLGQYVIEQQNPLFGLFPGAPAPVVVKYTQTDVVLPPFALYCLVNGIDLNVSINYTLLSLPPQGFLTVQSLTGASGGNLPWHPDQLTPPIVYQLGFGQVNQTAQIGQQGEAYDLQFYTDDIPSVGARIRFQSWSAAQSIARVRDTAAVLAEAAISGDNGVRAAIMTNLSPQPRNSDECEAAAGAAIRDREYPQFQGSYTVMTIPYKFENLYSPSMYDYPKTGEYFFISALTSRGVSGQNFFVNTVRTQVVEFKQEVLNISIDYGPDLYLEKLLPTFLEREQNILVPKQTVPPPSYITISEVLNAHLPTLDNAKIATYTTPLTAANTPVAIGTPIIVNSVTGNYITVDLGSIPATGCEVRNVDSGWGVANQGRIGLFTTQVFNLARTVRDQTWYLRTLNGGIYSRFSKAIRVVAPLVPAAPTLVSAGITKAVFDYAGDTRDIYGLELRAIPVTGTFLIGTPTAEDFVAQYVRNPVGIGSNIQYNVLGVYDPPSYSFPDATPIGPGDIVYTTCASDNTFQNIEIITSFIPGVAPTNAINASGVGFVADAYFYLNDNSNFGFQRTYPTSSSVVVGNYNNPQVVVPKISSLMWNSPNIGKGTDPGTGPMLNDVYDQNGNFHGSVPCPPAPIHAGSLGDIGVGGYDMIVSGAFYFPQAGSYVIQTSCDDAFLFGIDGAGYVSGPNINPNGQTHTAMNNIPIFNALNYTGYKITSVTFVITAAGWYPFEIDFTQWKDSQTLCLSVLLAPAGVYAPTAPTLALLGGNLIIPTPVGVGYPGSQGTPFQFGYFDYGFPTPDVRGNYVIGVSNPIGTLQQVTTGNAVYLVNGGIATGNSGLCTITTLSAHGFTTGQTVVIGCGWANYTSGPLPPQTGAVFCGQWVITVTSPTTFTFVIDRFRNPNVLGAGWEKIVAATGVPPQDLYGLCAALPTLMNVNSLPISSGILLQRPIFAPSDLVVDFTQPDIAELLQLLEDLSPSHRVEGLTAYFFNTTWDYSPPTLIPSFVVPALINIIIDATTQQVEWQVAQGNPSGYRIEVADTITGVTYNRFTLDHPNNTQKLTQFKLNPIDYSNTRNITITPFDALGDGIPSIISHQGLGVTNPYDIHVTINGLLASGQILLRTPMASVVAYGIDANPSQAWIDVPPSTGEVIISLQKFSYGDGSEDVGVEWGCLFFSPGTHVGAFVSATGATFNVGDTLKLIVSQTESGCAGVGITMSAQELSGAVSA